MADLTQTILPTLRLTRIPDLDLGPSAIFPASGGLSILNLPATPPPPRGGAGRDGLAGGARQVVVVLIDAVPFERFRSAMDHPPALLRALERDGVFAPLPSVLPSTTQSAPTTPR